MSTDITTNADDVTDTSASTGSDADVAALASTEPPPVLTRRQWAELNEIELGCMMPDHMPLLEENADDPIAF